jgi:hypothetical protein
MVSHSKPMVQVTLTVQQHNTVSCFYLTLTLYPFIILSPSVHPPTLNQLLVTTILLSTCMIQNVKIPRVKSFTNCLYILYISLNMKSVLPFRFNWYLLVNSMPCCRYTMFSLSSISWWSLGFFSFLSSNE